MTIIRKSWKKLGIFLLGTICIIIGGVILTRVISKRKEPISHPQKITNVPFEMEAEQCKSENYCELEGWKELIKPGASKDKYITNELKSKGKPADYSKLYLAFRGSGVS